MTERKLTTEFHLKAYSGYVLCERGFGSMTAAGLVVMASSNSEELSLVLSVGPNVVYGVKAGDYIAYSQGSKFKNIKGPNGGELFCIPENMVHTIEPADGVYPRPRAVKTGVVNGPTAPADLSKPLPSGDVGANGG